MIFNNYYNAKLLLTSEYLVLNGAKALAVPLRFGQRLKVDVTIGGFISWQSITDDGSEWFNGKYSLSDFSIVESSNPIIAKYPQQLLQAARKLNPEFCRDTSGYNVVSILNYPLLWGIGSSSTLIAAVAGWSGIDPFELHFEVSDGSGYDIACAVAKGPLIYCLSGNKPNTEQVLFSPQFADKLYFVYQGQKQDSAEGIKKFRNRNSIPEKSIIDEASCLTDRMLHSSSLEEFEKLMVTHEKLISTLIGVPPLKQIFFSDLPGEVKSLGAWGGDFCMLTWRDDPLLLSGYLQSKGLETWFNFSDIVL